MINRKKIFIFMFVLIIICLAISIGSAADPTQIRIQTEEEKLPGDIFFRDLLSDSSKCGGCNASTNSIWGGTFNQLTASKWYTLENGKRIGGKSLRGITENYGWSVAFLSSPNRLEIYCTKPKNAGQTDQYEPVWIGNKSSGSSILGVYNRIGGCSTNERTLTLVDNNAPFTPKAPVSLTALTLSSTQIKLTWASTSTVESGFRIERALGSSGSWVSAGTVGANIYTFTDNSREAGVKYYYRVIAFNSQGSSQPSNVASATTNADFSLENAGRIETSPGSTVTNMIYVLGTSGQPVSFSVQSISPSLSQVSSPSFTPSSCVSTCQTILTLKPAATATQGEYTVTVRGAVGSVTSTTSFKLYISEITSPFPLSVIAYSSTKLKLDWADRSNNEQGFKIERALSGVGPWTEIATVGTNVITFIDSGLTTGVNYFYRVRAYNAQGYSDYSNINGATPIDNCCSENNIQLDSCPSSLNGAPYICDTTVKDFVIKEDNCIYEASPGVFCDKMTGNCNSVNGPFNNGKGCASGHDSTKLQSATCTSGAPLCYDYIKSCEYCDLFAVNNCGNGIIDSGEECDLGNLNGKSSCISLDANAYLGGSLSCYPPGNFQQCKFNTEQCQFDVDVEHIYTAIIPSTIPSTESDRIDEIMGIPNQMEGSIPPALQQSIHLFTSHAEYRGVRGRLLVNAHLDLPIEVHGFRLPKFRIPDSGTLSVTYTPRGW